MDFCNYVHNFTVAFKRKKIPPLFNLDMDHQYDYDDNTDYHYYLTEYERQLFRQAHLKLIFM
jgi:hypothetical protein